MLNTIDQLAEELRLLLADVKEERRLLHVERHAIFQIVLSEGNLPMLHRLANMLEKQIERHGKDVN